MNNDALVATLGMDAVVAVHGYRRAVCAEAEERGLCLISEPLSSVVAVSPGVCVVVDPIDIRLAFVCTRGRPGLAGRTLSWGPQHDWTMSYRTGSGPGTPSWGPQHGWAMSYRTASGPLRFYAGPEASPLDLVPTAAQVLDWAVGEFHGSDATPAQVDLDEDPQAIQRLLSFLGEPGGSSPVEAFTPTRIGRS